MCIVYTVALLIHEHRCIHILYLHVYTSYRRQTHSSHTLVDFLPLHTRYIDYQIRLSL